MIAGNSDGERSELHIGANFDCPTTQLSTDSQLT